MVTIYSRITPPAQIVLNFTQTFVLGRWSCICMSLHGRRVLRALPKCERDRTEIAVYTTIGRWTCLRCNQGCRGNVSKSGTTQVATGTGNERGYPPRPSMGSMGASWWDLPACSGAKTAEIKFYAFLTSKYGFYRWQHFREPDLPVGLEKWYGDARTVPPQTVLWLWLYCPPNSIG